MRRGVVLLHGYSRRNPGDGLLVDETVRVLEECGIRRSDVRMFALDPTSFAANEYPRVLPLTPSGNGQALVASAVKDVLRGRLRRARQPEIVRRVRSEIERSCLAVGVGGGYLRTSNRVEAAKVAFAHLPQLWAASTASVPTFYMPQSIGPLRGVVGRELERHLGGIDQVCVRDDSTLEELQGKANVVRVPDLAVLAMTRAAVETAAVPTRATTRFVLAARALPRSGSYDCRVRELAGALRKPLLAYQSEGRGNDDRQFLSSLRLGPSTPLHEVFASRRPQVVISVRLHGAISALLAGIPAIHLAYERKGWGAYGDLGLSRFVHSARDFDVTEVAEQAHALAKEPELLWSCVDAAKSALGRERERLVHLVSDYVS